MAETAAAVRRRAEAAPAPDNRLREPLDASIGRLATDWRPIVDAWRSSPESGALVEFVDSRVRAGAAVFPADVFAALRLTPLAATRLVILGQDPYHGAGQAEGLAFSVPVGMPLPPSLRNILKERQRSGGGLLPDPEGGHLEAWARAGTLLLNTCLTVEEGAPGSHARRGWEALTDRLIAAAASDALPKVFMLWGNPAQSKAPLVQAASAAHLLLRCNHPSPLAASRGATPFIGSDHFRRAQEFLGASLSVPSPP